MAESGPKRVRVLDIGDYSWHVLPLNHGATIGDLLKDVQTRVPSRDQVEYLCLKGHGCGALLDPSDWVSDVLSSGEDIIAVSQKPLEITASGPASLHTLATNDTSNLGDKQPYGQLQVVQRSGPAAIGSDSGRSRSRGSMWDEAPLAKPSRSPDDARENHMSWMWVDGEQILCVNDNPAFHHLYPNTHWLMKQTCNAYDFKFGNSVNQEAVRESMGLGEYSFGAIATCGKHTAIGVATNAKSQKKIVKLALAVTGALANNFSCSRKTPGTPREIDMLVQKAQRLFEDELNRHSIKPERAFASEESAQEPNEPSNVSTVY